MRQCAVWKINFMLGVPVPIVVEKAAVAKSSEKASLFVWCLVIVLICIEPPLWLLQTVKNFLENGEI